jgi:hypothetical protein
MYACVQRHGYFVNTDYIEPTRKSGQRGTTRQPVRNILEAWRLVTKQRVSINHKLLTKYIRTYFGFLHVMQRNFILLGPWPDCMRSEESQLCSVLDGAITTYIWPENISANWQLTSWVHFFIRKNVSFLEALSQGIIVVEPAGSGYLSGLNNFRHLISFVCITKL